MQVEPGWFAVLPSALVGRNKPVRMRRFGRWFAVWRTADGRIAALDDRCPHRGASLGLGSVKDGQLACPFHGFEFDAHGACTRIPALGPEGPIPGAMHGEPVPLREAHGFVWMWPHPSEPEGEPPWFDGLDGCAWAGSAFSSAWSAHYTRAIENQLDMIHLPFVHASTIGRFTTERTLPDTHVEGLRIDMSAIDEQGGSRQDGFISFHFPNIWVNRIGPAATIFVAFAPVDEGETLMFLRTYQRVMTIPGLSTLVGWTFRVSNRIVLRQDQAVVESQRPRLAEPGGDVLMRGDTPIAAYRRLRKKLLDTASGGQA